MAITGYKLKTLGWRVAATVAAAFMAAFGTFAEETTNAVNLVVDDVARIKVMRSQLASAPLPMTFRNCVAATSAIKKRKSILDELYEPTDDATIDMEYEIVEMYDEAIRHFAAIRNSIGQIKKELDGTRTKGAYDEIELKEALARLSTFDHKTPANAWV